MEPFAIALSIVAALAAILNIGVKFLSIQSKLKGVDKGNTRITIVTYDGVKHVITNSEKTEDTKNLIKSIDAILHWDALKLATPKNNADRKKDTRVAGAAGAGGGTLLVLLAENLADSNVYKSWLIIISPSITIVLAAFWKWLTNKANSYLKEKEVEKLRRLYRKQIELSMTNPNISDSQKEILKKRLEELEMQKLEDLSRKIRNITIDN